MEFSTEKLKPIAEQLAALVSQELHSEQGAKIRRVESEIRRQLQAVGRMTLAVVLSQADGTPEQEIACACGGKLQYQRRRTAEVLSVFGWVSYKRSYYAECACGKGKAPLDEQFGLEPGKVTAGLAALLGMAGIELAFEYSRRWLAPFLLFEVSENTVRKETQAFGQLQVAREQRQIAQSQDEAYLQERLRTETDIPQRVYGSLDGAHVRIEERNKGHSEPEKWREMKVGCWYTVVPVPESRQTHRQRKKKAIGHQALRAKGMRYFCDLVDVDQFEPLFWATGCQAKADLAPEVVFVCDGAKWIWRLVETNFPKAVQIVDWYHAEERLERVARKALSEDTAETWLEETRSALWHGDTQFVISACEKLAARSPEASQATTYFRNNARRMQYDHFRAQGYMIGSGTVESGCKQIITRRLKCPGAQWTVQGTVLTAKARTAWLSGDWGVLCASRDQLPLAA